MSPHPSVIPEARRSKSAPRPTRRDGLVGGASKGGGASRGGGPPSSKNARSKLLGQLVESEFEGQSSPSTRQQTSTIRIRALRLADWSSIDRSLLQTILCKRTAASFVAAYTDSLVAEVSDRRSIAIYDWGCLCVIDEVPAWYSNVDEQQEEEAFEQYLQFLLEDVIYPCSSSDSSDVRVAARPVDEDLDSLTLRFSGGAKDRKNPIVNDVVFLEPASDPTSEDRRKTALACALALSQSLALKGVELELQRWTTESLNPLTQILAESGDVPDEEVTLRLYGNFHSFLHEVDGIGQALAMPADIDLEARETYLMCYEYLEVEARLKVMTDRFDIIKASLSLFKSLKESSDSTRKERIIIYLLVVCCVIAALELLVKAYRWHL